MENAGDAIRAVGDVFERLGPTNFVLIVTFGLIGWTVVKGKLNGKSSATAELSKAITPLTCQWSEVDRNRLDHLVEDVEKLRSDIAILKDRTARR